MGEMNERLLVREQVAYLREVIRADDAYLDRHNAHDDPGQIAAFVAFALDTGELRPSQVPSRVDAGAGIGGSRQAGSPWHERQNETPEARLARVRREAAALPLPPVAEVEERLTALATAQDSLHYLSRLRERMDEFEQIAAQAPEDGGLIGDEYFALVRFVRDVTVKQADQARAQDPAELLRFAESLKSGPDVVTLLLQQEEAAERERAAKHARLTPLPEPGDDGTREVFIAVSDHPDFGVQRGRRYELWPGHVLVKAGVVRPLATPPARAGAPPSPGNASRPASTGLPGYVADDHAEKLRNTFREDPARIRGRGASAFKALRDRAGVSESEERTVKRALGYKGSDGFEGFIERLYASVGVSPPNDGQETAE